MTKLPHISLPNINLAKVTGPVLNNLSNVESSPDFSFMKEHHHLSMA